MKGKEYQLREITPQAMDCGAAVCPGIYETNRRTYFIIGKAVKPSDVGLEGKVGKDELLIEIPRELLEGIGKRT